MNNYNSDFEVRLTTLGAMGGDTSKQYDSVYEIDLEILRLAGNSVFDVDTLPDADENKNKLVRYNDDLYYAKQVDVKAVKFTAMEDNSIFLIYRKSNNQTFEFSTDAETWTATETHQWMLAKGESIYLRGILSGPNSPTDYTQLYTEGKVTAEGNINTLFDYTAEDLGENFQLQVWCGTNLFYSAEGLDASKLYFPSNKLAKGCYQQMFGTAVRLVPPVMLPATNLTEQCYMSMFTNCGDIEVAPILPAAVLGVKSYWAMFNRCSNLNYIKCLATDITADQSTKGIMNLVAATGTFVKSSQMNNWASGRDGIPEGWQVVDDDTVPEYHWENVHIYKWSKITDGLKNFSIRLSNGTTKTYQAKEGMTWFDWVNSDLNTDGFVVKRFSGTEYMGYAVYENANSSYRLGFIFDGVGNSTYVPANSTIATSLSYYFYD